MLTPNLKENFHGDHSNETKKLDTQGSSEEHRQCRAGAGRPDALRGKCTHGPTDRPRRISRLFRSQQGPRKRRWDPHAYFGVHCVCIFSYSASSPVNLCTAQCRLFGRSITAPDTGTSPPDTHKRNRDMAAKTCQAQAPAMPAVAVRAASLGDGRTLPPPPRRGQIKEKILKDIATFVAATAAGLVKNGRGGIPSDK
jgi:hypothetical protein